VVRISEDHYIKDVAKELAALGMSKQVILAELGSITGQADARIVAKMRKVEGVLEIEPDSAIRLVSPEGDKS
jgi:hypothetical protein